LEKNQENPARAKNQTRQGPKKKKPVTERKKKTCYRKLGWKNQRNPLLVPGTLALCAGTEPSKRGRRKEWFKHAQLKGRMIFNEGSIAVVHHGAKHNVTGLSRVPLYSHTRCIPHTSGARLDIRGQLGAPDVAHHLPYVLKLALSGKVVGGHEWQKSNALCLGLEACPCTAGVAALEYDGHVRPALYSLEEYCHLGCALVGSSRWQDG